MMTSCVHLSFFLSKFGNICKIVPSGLIALRQTSHYCGLWNDCGIATLWCYGSNIVTSYNRNIKAMWLAVGFYWVVTCKYHRLFLWHRNTRPIVSGTFNNIKMTSWWTQWRLKSPASRLFTQTFVQTQIKKIKSLGHWSLWGEFTGNRWIPGTKRQ